MGGPSVALSSFGLCDYDKQHDQKHLVEEMASFGLSLQSVGKGSQGRTKAGIWSRVEVEVGKNAAFSLALRILSDVLRRSGGGLGPPISGSIKNTPLQTCLQVSLTETLSQLKFSLPNVTLRCARMTKTKTTQMVWS